MTKIKLPSQELLETEAKVLRKTALERYPNHKEIEFIIGLYIITKDGQKVMLNNINTTSTTVTTRF